MSFMSTTHKNKVILYIYASNEIRIHSPSIRQLQKYMHLKPCGHWCWWNQYWNTNSYACF